MSFRPRNLARLCAATALAAGAIGTLGAPAYAAAGKETLISLKNSGPDTAEDFWIEVDLKGLDTDKVEVTTFDGCKDEQSEVIACVLDDKKDLAAGEEVDAPFFITKKDGATGDAGTISFAIRSETADPNEANNVVTAPVSIAEGSGADLQVFAPDLAKDKPLAPGTGADYVAWVTNQGDQTVNGVDFAITLPKGTSFAAKYEDCTYSGQTAKCSFAAEDGVVLIPAEKDVNGDDEVYSQFYFKFPVTVAKDVAGPATLTGGSVTAAALGTAPYSEGDALKASRKATLPAGVAPQAELRDLDPSDNSDDFSVFVAATGGGVGGGDGDGDGDPDLPLTGTNVGVIGGVGAAVLVAGAGLFLVARRRRVVTVTPGDENGAL